MKDHHGRGLGSQPLAPTSNGHMDSPLGSEASLDAAVFWVGLAVSTGYWIWLACHS